MTSDTFGWIIADFAACFSVCAELKTGMTTEIDIVIACRLSVFMGDVAWSVVAANPNDESGCGKYTPLLYFISTWVGHLGLGIGNGCY